VPAPCSFVPVQADLAAEPTEGILVPKVLVPSPKRPAPVPCSFVPVPVALVPAPKEEVRVLLKTARTLEEHRQVPDEPTFLEPPSIGSD